MPINYMLIRTFFLTLSLSICLVSISKGQYNYPLSDYIIEVWSAEEGLPSNNLRHVAKDKDGFLWISTFNGLVRFDGNKFKTFDTNNVPVLSSSAFYSVLPLAGGSMYIATQASGLIFYKNGKFASISDSGNLPKSIQTSFLDNTGRLWIGTRSSGVYYWENKKIHRYSIPQLDDQSIQSITQDNFNNVWIASEGRGVAKISEDTFKIYTVADGLSSNIVNAIMFHEGKIYAGTEKGLAIYHNKKWIIDNKLGQIKINYIVAGKNRNLWFASGVGLVRMSHLNKYEYLSEKDGLPSRQISSIAFDDENNIWLTTKRGGLAQLKLSSFKNITPANGLSYKGINVIEEGKNGKFYVGSDNGDIDLIKDGIIKKLPMLKKLKSISVKDIFADDDRTLWIATYDGVIKKRKSEEKYFGIEQGLVSLKTRRILKDSKGVIWVGSRNGGINKIYSDDRVESITVKDGLGSDFVLSVDETPDGRIVVGTANGGLNIIYPDEKIEILKPTASTVGLSIFNVYIENNNRFWLATNIGLFCYENDKFTLINTKNGLPVETIFDIKEDDSGNLWATSILGFVRVSKNNVRDFVNGKLDKIEATLLNNSDGMVSHECTGATRFLETQEGTFWIPTIKGVSILDPQKLIINLKVPAVFIENVIVDDEVIESNRIGENEKLGKVTIKPGHRNYVINYTSLSMYSPEKVKFMYMLEGFDDDWVEIGTERHAKYTNIPYGNYTFKVMAANNNGVWSTDVAKIKIEVLPFFYETKWFIIIVILVFIVFTYLIYSYQTKEVNDRNQELLKLNAELDSFAYSVSHDLKAPLSSIQGLLNVARLEKGKNALEYYKLIDVSVEKLDNFIKDIIDYSKNARMEVKNEPVPVKEIIIGMLDGLAFLYKKKEIKVKVKVEDNLIINTDKTRFTFIVNNLLTNAFRYSDFTKNEQWIEITANVKNGMFYLDVEDNGQGIKKELQGKIYEMFYRANESNSGSGLGLYIVKESLDKLNGSITILSEYAVGTKAHVEIPV